MTKVIEGHTSAEGRFASKEFRDRDYQLVLALVFSRALTEKTTTRKNEYPNFSFRKAYNRAIKLGDGIYNALKKTNQGRIIESLPCYDLDISQKDNGRVKVIRIYDKENHPYTSSNTLVSEVRVNVEPNNPFAQNSKELGDVAQFDWGFLKKDDISDPNFRDTLELLFSKFVLRERVWTDPVGAYGGFVLLREGDNIEKTIYDKTAWKFINDRLSQPIELPKIYR